MLHALTALFAPMELRISTRRWKLFSRLSAFWVLLLCAPLPFVLAQDENEAGGSTDPAVQYPFVTMFPHPDTSRYWVSGQDNIIFQYHPSFDATYSGPNSMRSRADNAVSQVATLFLGYQLTHRTEVFVDVEEASGGGLSDGLGLAGFTNLDVVRNPFLSKTPYLARAMIRQIVPLSGKKRSVVRSGWPRGFPSAAWNSAPESSEWPIFWM